MPRVISVLLLALLLLSSMHALRRSVGGGGWARRITATTQPSRQSTIAPTTGQPRSGPEGEEEAAGRFWSRSYGLPEEALLRSTNNITTRLAQLSAALQQDPDSSRVTAGIVTLPLPDNRTLVVPVHDGMLQSQHAQVLTDSPERALLCAFSPRARHVVTAPSEEERPIDAERFQSLERALAGLNTSSAELLSDALAGTPPARIYRSFVAPRAGRAHILEPVQRAANRTAVQIDLALRQVRADQAQYLRNIDRSMAELEGSGQGEDGEDVGSDGGNGGREMQPRKRVFPLVLVLDNVRSAFNVGSLFRTGETAGIAELITCGISAHPPHPKLRKTAMNSLDVVPTRHFDDTSAALESLRAQGYVIVVMETTSKSQVYTDVDFSGKKVALVLGNEVTGVDTRIMDTADLIIEIPTFGVKNSLNVASAAPIVVFEVLRQWQLKSKS